MTKYFKISPFSLAIFFLTLHTHDTLSFRTISSPSWPLSPIDGNKNHRLKQKGRPHSSVRLLSWKYVWIWRGGRKLISTTANITTTWRPSAPMIKERGKRSWVRTNEVYIRKRNAGGYHPAPSLVYTQFLASLPQRLFKVSETRAANQVQFPCSEEIVLKNSGWFWSELVLWMKKEQGLQSDISTRSWCLSSLLIEKASWAWMRTAHRRYLLSALVTCGIKQEGRSTRETRVRSILDYFFSWTIKQNDTSLLKFFAT